MMDRSLSPAVHEEIWKSPSKMAVTCHLNHMAVIFLMKFSTTDFLKVRLPQACQTHSLAQALEVQPKILEINWVR